MVVEWAPDFYTDIRLSLVSDNSSSLAALVNALVLQYHLDPDHDSSSPIAALVKSIEACENETIESDVLIAGISHAITSECESQNVEKATTDEIVQYVPQISESIVDGNPDLTLGTFSKDSMLSKVFDALNINFRHAWCVDPIDVGDYWDVDESSHDTYAMFIESMMGLRTSDRVQQYMSTDNTGDSDLQQRQKQIRTWLDANPRSSMSEYGMHKVEGGMKANSVAVIQLDKEYFTLYKRNQGETYVLLTTKKGAPSRAVWRSLALLISSDQSFYDGSFEPVEDDSANDEREERIYNDASVQTVPKNANTDHKRIVEKMVTKKGQKVGSKKSHCTIC